MTHRIFSAILCLCLGTLLIFANDAIVVNLSDDHAQVRNETDFCYITFCKGATDSDNKAPISIKIENTTEKFVLIVFGTPYNQKTLKSLGFSFDKHFAGDKGVIESCDKYKFNDADIAPQDSTTLISSDMVAQEDGLLQFVLPIYIAQPCGPKKAPFSKYKLLESRKLNITLHVDLGPDTFKELSKLYDDLKSELDGKTFCTDARHKKEQTAPYQQRIDDLKNQLQHNRDSLWYNRNDKYKDFEQLINQLNGIQFNKEEACPLHIKQSPRQKPSPKPKSGPSPKPKPGPSPKPDNPTISLKDIAGQMNGVLTKQDNHKISHDAAVKQANRLLNKAKSSPEWGTSSYKKTITDNYNRIIKHK